MSKIYFCLNSDGVGAKISESIMSNDPEQVRSVSASFNQAHSAIDQKVEEMGGRVISAAGDEAIYELEESHLPEMENLIAQYQEQTGHTLTCGVGADVLQSVKAMIYGKMHDAGQVVEYDTFIEDEISPQEEQQAEEIAQEGDEAEQGAPQQEEAQPELNQESPQMQQNTQEQGPSLDQENDEQPMDQQLDAQPNQEESSEKAISNIMSEEQGANPEMQEQSELGAETSSEASLDEEGAPESLPQEEMPQEEGMEQEGQENLQQEDIVDPALEQEIENDPASEIKQKVMENLQRFQENSDKIKQMEQTDPESYHAIINMIDVMIEMAHEINAPKEEDIQELSEEDIAQEDSNEEAPLEESEEGKDLEEGEEELEEELEEKPLEEESEENEESEEEDKEEKKPFPKDKKEDDKKKDKKDKEAKK